MSLVGREDPNDAASLDHVAGHFRQFAGRTTETDALYGRFGPVVADDPSLHGLLLQAHPRQRIPPLFYAAIHDVLLAGADHDLAAFYPTIADEPRTDDPIPAFVDFVQTHRDAIAERIATRSTQTNSIGRSSALVLAIAGIASAVGDLAHVDVGTSAGLNLLLDHWTHRYVLGDEAVEVAGPDRVDDEHLVLSCDVTGPAPIPTTMPTVAWRMGLDRSPLDLDDEAERRWVLACIWPTDVARFRRIGAAIEVARRVRPPVRRADAVEGIGEVVASVPSKLHPVLTTSWVLNYLSVDRQQAFLAALDGIGLARDCSLVTFESPRRTPGLVTPAGYGASDQTVLGVYRWRNGTRHVEHVATAHAHGKFVEWWDTPLTAA